MRLWQVSPFELGERLFGIGFALALASPLVAFGGGVLLDVMRGAAALVWAGATGVGLAWIAFLIAGVVGAVLRGRGEEEVWWCWPSWLCFAGYPFLLAWLARMRWSG